MSNPGVKILIEKKLSNGIVFRIEDNIGESIHIHYGNEFRMDLTVEEFLNLGSITKKSINELIGEKFDLENYKLDPFFLDMFSDGMLLVEKTYIENIKLSHLEVVTKNVFGIPVRRKLGHSRIINALRGNFRELDSYVQENWGDISNRERLAGIVKKVRKDGYPYDDNYIVLFNNQNYVRDGQHRAACLMWIYGDIEVPVLRIKFKNNWGNIRHEPWLDYFLNWDRQRLKKHIKEARTNTKELIYRLTRKMESLIFYK